MDQQLRDRQLIEEYDRGGQEPRDAVAGLSARPLAARPGPGHWSIHEVVIHLQDSDAVGSDRMKRVIAEPGGVLLA